jgi:hypothetical protein
MLPGFTTPAEDQAHVAEEKKVNTGPMSTSYSHTYGPGEEAVSVT